jgi:hypothetical protein
MKTLVTRRNYMELSAHPMSVSAARRHVTQILTEWGRYDLIETAQLVISELATNAIKATLDDDPVRAADTADDELTMLGMFAGWDRRVWIGLHQAADGLVLEAWDRSRTPPRLVEPGLWEVGGRGLQLVNDLTSGWGYRWPKTGGKIVWALLGDEISATAIGEEPGDRRR